MVWWKKKEKQDNPDREILRQRDRDDLNIVEKKWPLQNRLLLGATLAFDWRVFLDQFGSVAEFQRLKRDVQMALLQKYLNFSTIQKREAGILRPTNSDKSFESLCASVSARLMSSYLICIMEDDQEWEQELAPKLDRLLVIGWPISFGTMPLPNDSKHFPMDDLAKPHTYFVRRNM